MQPSSDPPSKTAPVQMLNDGSPEPNQFRVLIVDDQAANRLILSRLLSITGYLTFEANDGLQALQSIRSHSTDLVIMDIEMPKLNGLDAIRQIRKLRDPRLASLPILAASGNPQTETHRELLEAGANDFLTKPFDTRLLLKTIARLLSPSPGLNPSIDSKISNQRSSQSESIENLP